LKQAGIQLGKSSPIRPPMAANTDESASKSQDKGNTFGASHDFHRSHMNRKQSRVLLWFVTSCDPEQPSDGGYL
jgi:hypothetical protein